MLELKPKKLKFQDLFIKEVPRQAVLTYFCRFNEY